MNDPVTSVRWAALVLLAGAAAVGCQQATTPTAVGTAATSRISSATSATAPVVTPQTRHSTKPATVPQRKATSGSAGRRVAGTLKTVPARRIRTLPRVPITASAAFGGGVSARVLRTAAVTVSAHGPGEVSGHAVAVTLAITNRSGASVSLDSVNVTAAYGADVPAGPFETKPAAPFRGALASGATRSGVYVFMIPSSQRHNVTIAVSYSPGHPVAVLQGAAG